VYALVAPDGAITGYKVRWREEDDDGVRRNRAKLFSARKLGSLERAREERSRMARRPSRSCSAVR
jgi:hypothetical protein